MSRKFEQEYRELMREQTPDLWSRIEEGVNNSPRSNGIIEFKPEGFSRKTTEVRKRRSVNHYQFRALIGAAACFVLLLIGVPALRASITAEKNAAEELPTVVIDGSQLQSEAESADAAEAAPVKESADAAAVIKESVESVHADNAAVETEEPAASTDNAETLAVAADVQTAAEAVPETVQETVPADASSVQTADTSDAAVTNEETGNQEDSAAEKSAEVPEKKDAADKKPSKDSTSTAGLGKMAAVADNKASAKSGESSAITVDMAEESEEIAAVGTESGTETVYAKVEISIKSVKAENGKSVYTAVVVKDPSGKLAAGTKICVQTTGSEFVSGKNYTATLTDNGETTAAGEKLYISSDITIAVVDVIAEDSADVLEIS